MAGVVLILSFHFCHNTILAQVLVVREQVNVRELRFPGVTICNTNPIKNSQLYRSESISRVVERIQASLATDGGDKKRKKRNAGVVNTVGMTRTWAKIYKIVVNIGYSVIYL